MISAPGQWAFRRRQCRALPAWLRRDVPDDSLLHGSTAGRSQPPAATFMGGERTPAARVRACGLAWRWQWPPRSSDALRFVSAVRHRSALVAADIGLHQGTPIVARYPLPAHATALGDQLQVAVALGRRGLCRCAWHRARTRRHNDRRIRMTLADLTVDIVPIVRPIAGKRCNRARNLLRQGTNLRAVIDILAGQLGGNDLSSVGVHPIWSFRQDRRTFAACLSTSHSPGPQSLNPVMSTSK